MDAPEAMFSQMMQAGGVRKISTLEKLRFQRGRLETQLEHINAAIQALETHPEFTDLLDTLGKALGIGIYE
jgi:chaperonin cofactor prefoldin